MPTLYIKIESDDAATLYAAMLVCTMSGGGSPENNVLMRFAKQIGDDVVATAMARLPRVSEICVDEWLQGECDFNDGVAAAASIIVRKKGGA